jgi:6-pyruvoyl-tetrahydropterin synthase
MILLTGIAGDFVASHQEPAARLEANLAGHSYRLGVDVAGLLNEQTGLIAPRLTVDRALRSTLAHFDHHDLGNLAGRGLPSAECLVRAAWQAISVRLPQRDTIGSLDVRDETLSGARLDSGGLTFLHSGHFAAAHRAHAPRISAAENNARYVASNNPAGYGHNYRAGIESPLPDPVPAPVWVEFDHHNWP